MSTTPSSPPAPDASVRAAKPARSKLEFWLVRGGMLVLLLLVGVQAHARFGYEMSLKRLQNRMAENDAANATVELLLSEVPDCIVGWPSRGSKPNATGT